MRQGLGTKITEDGVVMGAKQNETGRRMGAEE
jgi:hypothetical protein